MKLDHTFHIWCLTKVYLPHQNLRSLTCWTLRYSLELSAPPRWDSWRKISEKLKFVSSCKNVFSSRVITNKWYFQSKTVSLTFFVFEFITKTLMCGSSPMSSYIPALWYLQILHSPCTSVLSCLVWKVLVLFPRIPLFSPKVFISLCTQHKDYW